MDQFIKVYEKAFSPEFCDKTINFIDNAEANGFTLNRQDHDKAEQLEKEDEAIFLPDSEFLLNHTNNELVDTFNAVFWGKCYKEYAKEFSILNNLGSHNSYTMKIQKTKPGQGYHTWHCEASDRTMSNRILTWSVYLNDDFEAGETEFIYQQYRYKPSKGDCIIFPASYTHTHRGNPPIGGDKYIITGWVEF
jgi:hypothetical protein